jgi:hypothetical protein
MNEDIEFIDAETPFNNSQGSSFKEIIMTHISRIGTICTKEFRRGYWEKRPVKVGDAVHIIETYKEDTRDAYINAVDFLYDMLFPKLNMTQKKAIPPIKQQIELILASMDSDSKKNMDEETWKNLRLEYRRKIFRQLSLLLKELNYLDQGSIE